MADTTLTQVEAPTLTEPTQEPTTAEVADAPVSTAEPEAESGPEEESPFAVIGDQRFKDVYELADPETGHPEIRDFISRELSRSEERERQRADTRIAEETQKWVGHRSFDTLNGVLGNLADEISEMNEPGIQKAAAKLSSIVDEIKPAAINGYRQEGATSEANLLLGKVLEAAPDRRSRDEIEDFARTEFQRNGALAWDSILKRAVKASEGSAEKRGYERGLKEGREAAVESQQAEQRGNGAGPDATPARGGGSGISSMAEADRRYTLPPGHRDAISHSEYKALRERFTKK